MYSFLVTLHGVWLFVDIAYLRKTNIFKDTISYIRHKTGQRLFVHIEKCIQDIVKYYMKKHPKSEYVFPFITSKEPEDAFRQYQTALRYHNKQLKRISTMLELKTPLNSYTPRHTWATVAYKRQIPLSVISAAMGHTSEKTTQIYLESIDHSIIDQANKEILAYLNKLKSYGKIQ